MSSYNTVDLEASEAQPLVAAPRKLGKTLVVVALFGFAAGAATATAAPHVAAKMNFVTIMSPASVNVNEAASTDGGENVYVPDTSNKLSTANSHADKVTENGAATDGVTTETGTEQFQMNTNGGVEKMSANCDDASNTDGEQVHNPNCNTATVQDAQVTTGTGGETVRK